MLQGDLSNDLISSAFLSSEDLIQKFGTGFYNDVQFGDVSVSQLDIDELEAKIMRYLRDNGYLKSPTRLTTDTFAFQNDVLGVVQYNLKEQQISITIDSKLNTCWQRFVRCKELCQIYIDIQRGTTDSYGNKAVGEQIYHLVDKTNEIIANFEAFNEQVDDPNQSELHAFLMAVNLIFPESQREHFKNLLQLENQKDNQITLYDVAYAYRMPEFIVNFFVKKLIPYYREHDYKFMTTYVDFLREDFDKYLRSGIGLQITTIPYGNGGILKLTINRNGEDGQDELATPVTSVKEALDQAELEIEDADGNPIIPSIKGTSILMTQEAIFILKEREDSEWTREKAADDVAKIIHN